MLDLHSRVASDSHRGGAPLRAARWTILALAVPALLASAAAADGNVIAVVDAAGNLVAVGDELDNRIDVGRLPLSTPNGYVVTGLQGTTVNGLPEVVLFATGDVLLSMNGGDDRTRVDGFIPGNVAIHGGEGADFLALGCPVVGGDVLMTGGPGDDVVDIQDTGLNQDLTVLTGAGADRIHFFFARVDGDAVLSTGSGDDVVDPAQTDFGGSVLLFTGFGDDRVEVENETEIAGSLLVVASFGDDEVLIDEAVVEDHVLVLLGSGSDLLEVSQSSIGGLTLADGGFGADAFSDDGSSTFALGLLLFRFET